MQRDLISHTHQVIEDAEHLLERTHPIIEELRAALTALVQVRADLTAHDKELRQQLSGMEKSDQSDPDINTPLPVNKNARQSESQSASAVIAESPTWPKVTELPSPSFGLPKLESPWNQATVRDADANGSATASQATQPQPPASQTAERRGIPRRPGNPISVTFTIGGEEEMLSGWIVDRSSHGIGMLVDDALEPGSRLFIKPNTAPNDCPWFKAEVRHCQPEKGQYRIGCRFLSVPSWQHLRHFG